MSFCSPIKGEKMTPQTRTAPVPQETREEGTELPPLEQSDRLDQATFHARYLAMPPDTRAELIGGVVHMPSPLKKPHGKMTYRVVAWLADYEAATPGVEGFDNTTAILGEESEPQPDVFLCVAPECGGQTGETRDEYLRGAPELIVEVASSSESIDLHSKRDDYQRAGVKEYVVIALRQGIVYWFILREGRYHELAAGTDGIFRSEVYPGLWLDSAALLRLDGKRVKEVLQQGVATPEHAAFVERLAAVRANRATS
jgi:Uma2 family endonuclease